MHLMPENVSSFGSAIDSLVLLIAVLTGIGLLVAEAALLYSAIRFRRRPGAAAGYIRGETWRQLRWIVIPVAVVLLADLYIDMRNHAAWEEIKGSVPKPDREVRITGQQFAYSYTYPGNDGELGTRDDFQTVGELHVPVGEKVVFYLEARDVLHSFWVPALRLKQDAVPGRTIRGWFKATRTGRYEVACAELCGVAHSMMRSTLVVDSREDYERWLEQAGKPALQTARPAAAGEEVPST